MSSKSKSKGKRAAGKSVEEDVESAASKRVKETTADEEVPSQTEIAVAPSDDAASSAEASAERAGAEDSAAEPHVTAKAAAAAVTAPTQATPSSDDQQSYAQFAVQAAVSGAAGYNAQFLEQRGIWWQLMDPRTHSIYYQNCVTYETQWEPPVEWNTLIAHNTEVIEEKKRRKIVPCPRVPARTQVAPEVTHKVHWVPEGASEYNIWYDRWVGDHWSSKRSGVAQTRCDSMLDSGLTKGDSMGTLFHCFHFAKGCCHEGKNCLFLHHVPNDTEAAKLDMSHDIFGRPRHGHQRDDMGGTGVFDSDSKTLYIGGIPPDHDIEDVIWDEFGEWGEIECRIAKIAMGDQLLKGSIQLNVRWAKDDPNPAAKEKSIVNSQKLLVEAAARRGMLDTEGFSHSLPEPAHNEMIGAPMIDIPTSGPLTRDQIAAVDAQKKASDDWARLQRTLGY